MSIPSTSTAASVAEYAASRYGLQGKLVVVTGGSKGIGAAIVEHFCRLGAKVLTCARNQEEVAARVSAWQAAGLSVTGVAADVSTEEGSQALVSKVKEEFGGKLHVLVNNVGSNIRKPTQDFTPEEYDFLMSTNLRSAFRLCQLFHPMLTATEGDKCILFNSSVAGGPTALRSGSIYAMTKASMNQLSKNLACEWAKDGIRVCSVGTWYTGTELANQVLQNEAYRNEVHSRTPLRRIATVDEVADMFTFLASPAASFITGQTYAVDGGYTIMGMH